MTASPLNILIMVFIELINSNYTGYFQDKNGVYYFNGLAKLTPNNIFI